MMYVSERSPDSICDTALAFFVIKSLYALIHRGGSDSAFDVAAPELLIASIVPIMVCRPAFEKLVKSDLGCSGRAKPIRRSRV